LACDGLWVNFFFSLDRFDFFDILLIALLLYYYKPCEWWLAIVDELLERLLAVGYSRKPAMEMIGSAVVEEIWAVLREQKPFDRARFTALLEQLG